MEVFFLDDQKIRVSKLLTEQNICSRTKAEKWVEQKYIKANGKIIDKPEHKINKTDFILIDKRAVSELNDQKTILLNKPTNFVSSFQDPKYEHALSLVSSKSYSGKNYSSFDLNTMGVVGRLDADSRGLLIYSQDGSFAKSIIGPESNVEKEYIVKVKGTINEKKLSLLRFGLSLEGKPLKPAIVEQLENQKLKFILTEGKNRQIRRMCGAVDLEVVDLFRIRIGNIVLPRTLKEGDWIFMEDL
jgi:23S rRNA pseudouridine2604 synthase